MKSQSKPNHWQNWAVFGIRVILVLMLALIAYVTRTEGGRVMSDHTGFIAAFAAAAAVNLVLAALIFIRPAVGLIPYAIGLGDWVLAGALAFLAAGGTPEQAALLAAVSAATLAAGGLLRLGMIGGSLHALGVLAVTYGVLWLASELLQRNINAFVPTSLAGLTLILGVGFWVFMRDETVHGEQRSVSDVARQKDAEIAHIRASSHAIADMITTLSSTLDYEKILDKVLDLGHLSVRDADNRRIVGAVLLYANDNTTLRIANARGMNTVESTRSLRGDQGIIGKALKDCVPIIGGAPYQDAQLREFVSFSNLKASLCIPLRAGFDNFGALLFAADRANAFTDDNIETLNALATQATVAMQNAVLYKSLLEEKERILSLEENARAELVRDLHDIPTQTVAAITMRLRIIQRMLEQGNTAAQVTSEMREVEEMAQRASEEMRHVLFKMRPLILETKGLAAALDELAAKTKKTYRQNVSVKVGKDVEQYLDANAMGGIFYLVEEAVNNARKYAEAELISVVVARKDNYIVVRISDNGKGFDADGATAQSILQGSFGMTNMRERAELLNGTVKLESKPGQGTTVTAVIPIHRETENGQRISQTVQSTKLSSVARERVTQRVRGSRTPV